MDWKALILLPACLVATFLGVGLQRRIALAKGIVDIPNARSSHEQPVPRGGGLAIAAVVCIGIASMALAGLVPVRLALALVVPGVMVAGVGFADDLRGVPARTRFGVQLIAAGVALVLLGGWDPDWTHRGSGPWLVLQLATVAGMVWSINLFNFMDGIDGIAGSEAACLGLGGALLLSLGLAEPGFVMACSIVGAAAIGFLIWNWPPAKVFMGDVGSGFLGLVYAVLALASARENPAWLCVWVILGATFLVDSGVTLVRRLIRGERVYEAHRTHAYQWLARRLRSHRAVTLLYLAVNVLWLLPMAWFSLRFAAYSGWIMLAALAPLLAAALLAGAGRPETRSRD